MMHRLESRRRQLERKLLVADGVYIELHTCKQCCASSVTVLTVKNSYVTVKNSYDLIGTVTNDENLTKYRY